MGYESWFVSPCPCIPPLHSLYSVSTDSICKTCKCLYSIDLVDDRKIRSRGGRKGVGIIGDLIFKTAFVDKVYP